MFSCEIESLNVSQQLERHEKNKSLLVVLLFKVSTYVTRPVIARKIMRVKVIPKEKGSEDIWLKVSNYYYGRVDKIIEIRSLGQTHETIAEISNSGVI